MAGTSGKKGGKNRKFGRNSLNCKVYRDSCREDRNRKRRMQRHLRSNPGDGQTADAYQRSYLKISGNIADIGLTARGAALNKRYAKQSKARTR